MRTPIFAASLVTLAAVTFAAGRAGALDASAPSRIISVTVYPTGAEVTRTLKVHLEPGEHVVMINDLPQTALPQSIRVEGKSTGGQVQIGSVDSRQLMLPRADSAALAGQRREIEDKIEKLRDQRQQMQAQIQAAEAQKMLIAELTKMPARPGSPGVTAVEPDWAKLFALVGDKTAEAQRTILDTNLKIRDIDRQIAELNKTLATLAPAPEARTEVKVFVTAAATTDTDFTVRYQVSAAGWMPFYDARLDTGAKNQPPKLRLIRRAAIQQRTGESWDDIALVLSTTRPSAATAAPDLQMLSVDYQPERPPMAAPAASAPMPAAPMARRDMAAKRASTGGGPDADREETENAPAAQKAAEVVAGVEAQGFQVLYTIPGKVSVAPTGEQKRVQISTEDLDPALVVRSVPRLDTLAYLYAKLSLPKSGGPILPGAVSLFRDGTFVGQGRVPLLAPGEDYELGFGADDLVKIKRVVIEDKTGETGVFTTSRADERNYTITAKNLHLNPVAVQIIDRVPVSMQQDIKVEPTYRPSPTRKDIGDRRGTIAWDMTLAPDQETQIAFGYKVTAPAGKPMLYHELTQQEIQQNQRPSGSGPSR